MQYTPNLSHLNEVESAEIFNHTGATFTQDERRILSWGDDGTVRLWDIQGDFDFPRDHIRLLVEVVTGTVMNDVGNVSALHPEEWTKRKKQYQKVAEQHLITCQYRNANLYLRQKRLWGAGE
jgi:WD40 repeat protein